MNEVGHLLSELGYPMGILFLGMAFALMLGSFAVSVPRLLHRENHHFA